MSSIPNVLCDYVSWYVGWCSAVLRIGAVSGVAVYEQSSPEPSRNAPRSPKRYPREAQPRSCSSKLEVMTYSVLRFKREGRETKDDEDDGVLYSGKGEKEMTCLWCVEGPPVYVYGEPTSHQVSKWTIPLRESSMFG